MSESLILLGYASLQCSRNPDLFSCAGTAEHIFNWGGGGGANSNAIGLLQRHFYAGVWEGGGPGVCSPEFFLNKCS